MGDTASVVVILHSEGRPHSPPFSARTYDSVYTPVMLAARAYVRFFDRIPTIGTRRCVAGCVPGIVVSSDPPTTGKRTGSHLEL